MTEPHSIRGPRRTIFDGMKNNLADENVVVVGGTSGIGLAVAEAARREGAHVVVGSRRNGLDVTDEASVRAFFAECGEIDHLVYTAGDSLRFGRLGDLDSNEVRAAFEVRIFAALGVLKHARVRKTGSITLTSGVASQRPSPGWTLGTAVTSAMEGIGRALAVELAPVRVNVVCPGVVRTALWSPMTEAARNEMYAELGSKLLVGRVGEPDEVAATYLNLMKSGFTTGQVVIVDGGASLI